MNKNNTIILGSGFLQSTIQKHAKLAAQKGIKPIIIKSAASANWSEEFKRMPIILADPYLS